MRQGRFIDDRDVSQNSKICVIEASLIQTLFPLDRPLGKTVRVGRHYFEVVGVMDSEKVAVMITTSELEIILSLSELLKVTEGVELLETRYKIPFFAIPLEAFPMTDCPTLYTKEGPLLMELPTDKGAAFCMLCP